MAKKKIQLQDANGNVLHPLTLGECVTMDNGENLDTLMSKSQMFTPTIAQDKSMFKVGTGIDVDYSANVKDGAYESLMFKGKSLVNLCPNGVINYTATSDWDGYNGIGQASNTQGYSWKTLQDLKPNTKYFISCYVETFDVAEGQYYLLNNRNDSTVFGDSLYIRTTGLHKWVLTSKSEFTEAVHIALRCQNAYARGAIKIRDIMIIEYQEGMEEWDIPYFEGICDVKMPILRNVGKNLLNPSLLLKSETRYGITKNVVGDTITLNGTSSQYHDLHFTPNDNKTGVVVKKGKFYKLTIHSLGGTSTPVLNPAVKLTLNDGTIKWLGSNIDLTNSSCDGLLTWFRICPQEGNSFNNYQIKLQLEESSTSTSYESYKTNILRTPEEIVLREVNGVQDTYNPLTGEYTKRIGEVVLDGSENEWEDWSETSFVLRGNYFSDAVEHTATTAPRLKCNNMVAGEGETPRTVRYYRSPTVLWTMVGKNNGETLDQFKTWLSQNPTTIQYILAEPVTTIVKPSTMTPFAYQNGHVVVESGFEGQSLLPEIEYSVVTGRTGQVTQNTKVLRKQEQQIISLEELLLTQVVQMEYERTLLQFDYELQMMMLG